MARADTKTWLSLDEWAKIIGMNPLHFNGLSSTLFGANACGSVWFQYAWQHSDRVGREEVAQAIYEAEQDIAKIVGYNLVPDWTIEERSVATRPLLPEMYSGSGRNSRGLFKSIELNKGHVISGGVMASASLPGGLGAAVVRTDPNLDGYSELCTVEVATTLTDENQIHVYFEGKGGASEWEIRPITVSLSGALATITFNSWQIVDPTKLDTFESAAVDGDVGTNYETTVDVYRVYNDPATQVQFMWENENCADCCSSCVACEFGTQAGCFKLRNARLGLAVPSPASWDSDEEEFTSSYWSACRGPDQVRFWYYSGYQDKSISRYNVSMSPYWKHAVAYYAASKMDRPVCGCSNVNQFIEHWRKDSAFQGEAGGFQVTPEQMGNQLGTSMGALYAYKAIHKPGVRIIKG